jgi:hypothetical protein
MNVMDLLKDQFSGEVIGKLAGASGANQNDLTKMIGAALPGLLGSLGKVASTKEGSGKLADAIGKLGSDAGAGGLGDLGKILTGGAGAGGNILSSLLGGNFLDGLVGVISKFTGISPALVKTALGFIAPMVLGKVGKTIMGNSQGKISGQGISQFFESQKENIEKAMPAGFSLASIPGYNDLGKTPVPAAAPQTGFKAVPILILLGLLGAIFAYVFNKPKVEDSMSPAAPPAMAAMKAAEPAEGIGEMVTGSVANAMKEIVPTLPELDFDGIKSNLTEALDGLTGKLEGVSDSASAEAILPDLQDMTSKFDAMKTSLSALPASGKSMIGDLIKSALEKLDPIISKVTSIPGVGDAVKGALDQLKAKLMALVE